MLTAILVAVRIFANPISNALQKRLTQHSADPLVIMAVTHLGLAVVCLPFAWAKPLPQRGPLWASLWLCAGLAVASNVLLVYALRRSDLSVLGPLNAYKSVISLVLGLFLLGEVPTGLGVAGIGLIVGGSAFLAEPVRGGWRRLLRERGVQLRLVALLLSATEAVFLKQALLKSSPVTVFLYWSILGFIWLTPVLFRLPGRGHFARHGWTYLALAAATGAMQLSTLLVFGRLPVGYALSLFQLSSLVSVWLGYRYFAEANIRQRLLGSAVMATGAILVVWRG